MIHSKEEQQEILKTSWQIAVLRRYHKLLLYAFIPAIFTTIFSVAIYSLRGFQYWTELIAGNKFTDAFLYGMESIFDYIGENPAIGFFLFFLGFLFTLGYIFLPLLSKGAIISLLPKILKKEEFQFREGIYFANMHFLKLFQLRALLSPFRLSWIFLCYWLLKNFNPESLVFFAVPLVIWFIVAVVMNFVFIFAEYALILKDMGVVESTKYSLHIVFMRIERVTTLLYFSILVGIRVFLNTILVFGIPIGILLLAGYLATSISPTIALVIGLLFGIVSILILCYILSLMHIFTMSCWTMLFLKCDKELTPQEAPQEEKIDEETLINIAKAHEALLKAGMGSHYTMIEEKTKAEAEAKAVLEKKIIEMNMEDEKELDNLK